MTLTLVALCMILTTLSLALSAVRTSLQLLSPLALSRLKQAAGRTGRAFERYDEDPVRLQLLL